VFATGVTGTHVDGSGEVPAAALECDAIVGPEATEFLRAVESAVRSNDSAAGPNEVQQWIVVRAFERDYDAVIADDAASVRRGVLDGVGYWTKYWSLQKSQFLAWCAGHLSGVAYRRWLDARMIDYESDVSVGDVSFRAGWNADAERQRDRRFVEFMERVFCGAVDEALRVELARQERGDEPHAVVEYHGSTVSSRFAIADLYVAGVGFIAGAVLDKDALWLARAGGSALAWRLSICLWVLELRSRALYTNLAHRGIDLAVA